jgi:hypothetical protein
MKLSPDHRRFLLFEQGIGGGLVNLAIAALLCWLLFRHAERVPVTGSQGMVVDTIASAFMIPFATCLIVTRIVRRQVRRGRIPLLDRDLFCALMPRNILLRAILLGFVCAATIYPIIVVGCISLGANSVSIQHFWLFKLGSLARKARSSRHSSLSLRSHVNTLCSATDTPVQRAKLIPSTDEFDGAGTS